MEISILIIIFLIVAACALVIEIVESIAAFIVEYYGVVIFLFVLILIILALVFANRLLNKKYRKSASESSPFIKSLRELNASYNFTSVENFNFENEYDNENFYDTISEKDYLVYCLADTQIDALNAIASTRRNADFFKKYSREVEYLKNQMSLNTQSSVLFVKKYKKIEAQVFKETTLCPNVSFQIKVRLVLTTLRGLYVASKTKTFCSDEVEEIIEKINNNENGFYKEEEIWYALCRVERGKVTNKIRFAIYERDGNRCCNCGAEDNLEIDHIYPISKGGKTTFDNLQTLCHDCNVRKSNTLTAWQKKRYYQRYKKQSELCPWCKNGHLVKKNGKRGEFYGCSNYPNCRFIKSI